MPAGRRHFPEEVPDNGVSAPERPEAFGMRSAQDMYKDFPALVRSSFPLYVRDAGPQARPICICRPCKTTSPARLYSRLLSREQAKRRLCLMLQLERPPSCLPCWCPPGDSFLARI